MATDDSSRIRFGGVAPVGAAVEDAVELTAARFTGGILGDRVVVRLVPEPLAVAEDGIAGNFGIPPAQRTHVGFARHRSIGFPAWVIVQHPDQVGNALNLAADLKRIEKSARSKPGNAKDAIDAIALRLAGTQPDFLPTFYEEAARGYLRADNEKYAATMFGKAREAERTHKLAIDEERHQQAFTEFAQAGAVNVKEITAEVKALSARHTPERAHALFLELNRARARGGLAPYTGMAADLDRLTRAAGLDSATERRRLVATLLGTDGIESAGPGFWQDHFADIAALLQAGDETARAAGHALVRLVPRAMPVETWVAYLYRWNLVPELTTGRTDAADWLQAILNRLGHHSRRTPRLIGLIGELAPRLRGHVFVVPNLARMSADQLDAVCEAGATVRPRSDSPWGWRLDLKHWAGDEQRRDLRFLLADPVLGPRAGEQLTRPEVIGVAAGHEGMRPFLTRMADEAVTSLSPRPLALPTVRAALATARNLWPAREHVGEQLRFILGVATSSAQLLADSLRLGLVAELGWPAGEDAWQRNTVRPTHYSARGPNLFDAWPAIGFGTRHAVEFVDGEQVVGRAGTTDQQDALISASMIDGVVGILTTGNGRHIQWGNRVVDTRSTGMRKLGSPSLPVPGGRQLGTALLRIDGTEWPGTHATVMSDGTRVWVWPRNGECYEIDPATGRRERDGLPPWLATQQERFAAQPHLELQPQATFRPVSPTTAGSPVSTVGSMHASAVFADRDNSRHWVLVAADGSLIEFSSAVPETTPWAPVLRPGGGLWVLTTGGRLLDRATGQQLAYSYTDNGTPAMLDGAPPAVWYQARPRDAAAGQAMRHLVADQVAPLLTALEPVDRMAPSLSEVDPRGRAAQAVQRIFGRPIAPALGTAIILTAHQVRQLAREVDDLRAGPAPAVAEPAPTSPTALADAASESVNHYLRRGYGTSLGRSLAWAADLLRIRPRGMPNEPRMVPTSSWPELLGREAALLFLAASPATSAPDSARLLDAFDMFAAYGYLHHRWTVREVDVRWTNDLAGSSPATGQVFLAPGAGTTGSLLVAPMLGLSGPVDGHPVRDTLEPAGPRDLAGLQRLARRIRAGERFAWDPEKVSELSAHTGLSTPAAAMLLAGAPKIRGTEKNFLSAELRELLGVTATQADIGRTALHSRFREGALVPALAAAVPGDPERLLSDGPDVAGLAEAWGGSPATLTLTAEQHKELGATFRQNRYRNIDALVYSQIPADAAAREVYPAVQQLTWLTHHLPLDDPNRGELAERWQQFVRWLPADKDEERAWAEQAREILLAPPRPGYALDPRVSTPSLVAEVAEHHGLSAEAATYYLQLLALPHPTDVNIRRWNGWTPRRLAAARTELLDRELVVEGNRTRARRTVFLPGGWNDRAKAPVLPVETWKQALYPVNPAVNSHLAWSHPVADLFAGAWQRVLAGNGPGYDDLETERRRRR